MTANDLIQKLILGDIKLSQGLSLTRAIFGEHLSKESLQWLSREIDHYEDASSLPEYRIIDCDVKILLFVPYLGLKEEILDTSSLNNALVRSEKPYASPNKMLILQGIESIENTLDSSGRLVEMDLHQGQVNLLMRFLSLAPGVKVKRVYQESRVVYIRNIVSSVRNKLIAVLQTEVGSLVPDPAMIQTEPPKKKRVFISYGWDNDTHIAWVQQLAERLSEYFVVRIDKKTPLGTDLNVFMEKIVTDSDRVLLILTPVYKEKADKRQNGIGYESVLISGELYKNQGTTKFIPIIRKGKVSECFPNYLGSRKGLDMTDDALFEQNLKALIDDIGNN